MPQKTAAERALNLVIAQLPTTTTLAPRPGPNLVRPKPPFDAAAPPGSAPSTPIWTTTTAAPAMRSGPKPRQAKPTATPCPCSSATRARATSSPAPPTASSSAPSHGKKAASSSLPPGSPLPPSSASANRPSPHPREPLNHRKRCVWSSRNKSKINKMNNLYSATGNSKKSRNPLFQRLMHSKIHIINNLNT